MENKKYVIGADIGGTTVKLGLFEEDGTLLEKWEIPTVIEGDGTAVLRDIAAEIQKCREKHNGSYIQSSFQALESEVFLWISTTIN